MESLAVIEGIDVVEDRPGGLSVVLKTGAVDKLLLERAPEAFYRGVIVAVATAAHARRHVPGGQMLAVRFAGVLAATVRVLEQPCFGLSLA